MKNGKRQMTEEIELINQDKIRTLGEKETYKYFVILEADTIRIWKKKLRYAISEERENFSKPNYIAEISLKG